MLFNSTLYLTFLVGVVWLYYQLSPTCRRVFLLVSSYIFYAMWSVAFSFLMMGSIVVAHYTAVRVQNTEDERKRRSALVLSLIYNLGILCVFKYADLVSGSIWSLVGIRPWPALGWVLPLGLSFYTFQAMSYTVDVYRRDFVASKSIWDVALFIGFFPHLVAGPILRSDVLIPQLSGIVTKVDRTGIYRGILLIIWGLVKKVYVGDPMGLIANEGFSDPARVAGFDLLMSVYAFAVQIYCDFSGYSDIAIGSALLLGIKLPENFRAPYLAQTITEFWRRWHISLSTWLRDYLYIPLGGSRRTAFLTYRNLMITMLLGGLWHGAGWNWVVWGGLQGVMLAMERGAKLGEAPGGARGALRWLITVHLVCLSWVPFRAHDFTQTLTILERIVAFEPGEPVGFGWTPLYYFGALVLFQALGLKRRWIALSEFSPTSVRVVAYAAFIIFVYTFGGASNREFIYFQF
jgi:alginate O-acetyltransferase complex protein AlgI